jgi:hypothetical protein
MGVKETALIYLLIGLAMAAASILLEAERSLYARSSLFLGTLFFWPVFAPFILSRERAPLAPPVKRALPPMSPIESRIAATEKELVSALQRMRGVAEAVLSPELDRVRSLSVGLKNMAQKLGEMDALLATPEFSAIKAGNVLRELKEKVDDPDDGRVRSVEARLRNIERLRGMRTKTADDLERALYKMEEMSSQMIVLELAGGKSEVLESIRELALSIDCAIEGSFGEI